MDMNPLGATGLKVTRLGFGAMHLNAPALMRIPPGLLVKNRLPTYSRPSRPIRPAG